MRQRKHHRLDRFTAPVSSVVNARGAAQPLGADAAGPSPGPGLGWPGSQAPPSVCPRELSPECRATPRTGARLLLVGSRVLTGLSAPAYGLVSMPVCETGV